MNKFFFKNGWLVNKVVDGIIILIVFGGFCVIMDFD